MQGSDCGLHLVRTSLGAAGGGGSGGDKTRASNIEIEHVWAPAGSWLGWILTHFVVQVGAFTAAGDNHRREGEGVMHGDKVQSRRDRECMQC